MSYSDASAIGLLQEIRLYPFKSMQGESLDASQVTDRGLVGDRGYALIDIGTGKVVSAKNPRRWPQLLDYAATYAGTLDHPGDLPPACVTLPSGDRLLTTADDFGQRLSTVLQKPVRLVQGGINGATAEGYWPDVDWLTDRGQLFDFALPPGTFFDGATIHLVTTATLARLQALAPDSKFDVRRFRPNLVVDMGEQTPSFAESKWIGRHLTVGEVVLRIDGHCPRCVMTTIAQRELPYDPSVLRTIVKGNDGNAGVYASVITQGIVRLNDVVRLDGIQTA